MEEAQVPPLLQGFGGMEGDGTEPAVPEGAKEKAAWVPARQLAAQAKLPTLPAHSATSQAESLHRIYF